MKYRSQALPAACPADGLPPFHDPLFTAWLGDLTCPVTPPEREALRYIVECGDIATDGTTAVLVVQASAEIIDLLSAFEAGDEDREDQDNDFEEAWDLEPRFSAAHALDQRQWSRAFENSVERQLRGVQQGGR